jgi:hypothetical protein
MHRPVDGEKGPCTSFPNCDVAQKSKYAFSTWRKVEKGSPTPAPTNRQPDPTPNPTPAPTRRQPDPTPNPTPAPAPDPSPDGPWKLREAGGTCLSSQGFHELLGEGSKCGLFKLTSSCRSCSGGGTLVYDGDEDGEDPWGAKGTCLDYFRDAGKFGLYHCHGGENQQFRQQGAQLCNVVTGTCLEIVGSGPTPTPAPSPDDSPKICSGWCKSFPFAWSGEEGAKCEWRRCGGCPECQAAALPELSVSKDQGDALSTEHAEHAERAEPEMFEASLEAPAKAPAKAFAAGAVFALWALAA